MAVDPQDTDPADQDPRERDLRRRTGSPETSLWLVLGGIALLGGLVYVVSALF
ncbi:MAG: LPXTG cell wall anchor domain-containing protein [Brevundimonas sp.]|nr:MAG: LPXTG cell wall anchor domain-containing protein [Brevundimonas sp.]